MLKQKGRKLRRGERKRRVRAKISGTALRPRLSVFRSLRSISAQAIDDVAGKTIAQANLRELGKKAKHTVAGGAQVGKLMAERLEKAKIKEVVFDRSGYKYHGKIKAFVDAVRENGIKV